MHRPRLIRPTSMHVLTSGVHFDDVLHRFATFMSGEQIRFAVIGGLALQAFGPFSL